MSRKHLPGIIVVVCVAGFLYDVVTWAREGQKSIGDVLVQYWWAELFIVSYGITALVKKARRSGRTPNDRSSG